MPFAVHAHKAKLFVGVVAVSSICMPVCWAKSVLQAAFPLAGTRITLVDDNTLTRTGYTEDQGNLHATMEVQLAGL